MVKSGAEILEKEFGKTLGSKGVHILDPFAGTGNFTVHLMQEIPRTALPHKFAHELHANEIMLLPYYIASMNIEHAFYEATGQYEPFEGICLVDTFGTAEGGHGEFGFFNEENSARGQKQRKAPIFVVIGNPPYNTNQADENDNNKNRKYPVIDARIAATYAADSKATLRNKLSDPYIKAIRWASDRIGSDGIVALVTNSGFLDAIACDGMRKNLAEDFDAIYVLDLGGNVRKNPKLSGTTHNVFGIQVGVCINLLVRNRTGKSGKPDKPAIYYAAVPTDWRREEKYRFLEDKESARNIEWHQIQPDAKHTWLREGLDDAFDTFMPLGTKLVKQMDVGGEGAIFKTYSLGVSTNRDSVVYDFNREALAKRVEQFCDDYNAELARYDSKGKPENRDEFLSYEKVKWSRNLKRAVKQGIKLQFEEEQIRCASYRPFTKEFLYFAETVVDEEGTVRSFFPGSVAEQENVVLWLKVGMEVPMFALATNRIPNLLPQGGSQCFPFYTTCEDGSKRRENMTIWALL